ncbi:RNA polymerase sigma-70 factor (ECF subfamily) [Saccharomonospora amisosensis]|uniref:RNA polymerase sigma-70 factor (ECF subfamily) n=1 Tax=Saccharomonospora amisosensis TaxID=1128677 RepID=A0A7X5ZS63_9PSEU|nr:RNA polymerase sigma factor ShbA [Saccharomonospora amisosensis]NIJ13226.1 RNA polymerase sigma-70 factor (ECF subfamily) [Saccharomonospora amisosensis]
MDSVVIATESIPTPTEQLPRQRDNPLRRPDIDRVVSEAVQGDSAAVRQLIALITPIITRYCRARLGLRDLAYVSADDVAQEICFAVLRALPNYQDRGGSFLFLVHAIASNKVSDAYRLLSRDHSEPTPEVPEPIVRDNEPERHALNTDLGHRLNQLLARLPSTQREILILRVVVGLSAAETAQALGLSPANVRTSQHRALTRLRALISLEGEF